MLSDQVTHGVAKQRCLAAYAQIRKEGGNGAVEELREAEAIRTEYKRKMDCKVSKAIGENNE